MPDQPDQPRVAIFTNEYPPHIYGGAGVHVEYLSRALARELPVEVRCFGDQDQPAGNPRVRGYEGWPAVKQRTDPRFGGALDALSRDLLMAKDTLDADVVHTHTWYTAWAGLLAKILWGVPLVVTVHSLEPLRPWKVEQLGNAYRLSSWLERTALEQADAIVAVSRATREDILRLFAVEPARVHVIPNGIDADEYRYTDATDALVRHGVDPNRPYVLFVGRITRQKGIIHLVNAVPDIDPGLQVVLCAGAPDTPEIGQEMTERVGAVGAGRDGLIWIREMLPRSETIELYSHATVFCCPSVYEPFGIINLEAMACETPVVASAVGGIPEVVVDGETGILVDPDLVPGTVDSRDSAAFSSALAEAINRVALDPALAARLGRQGRARVEARFSWEAVARQTIDLYREVTSRASQPAS